MKRVNLTRKRVLVLVVLFLMSSAFVLWKQWPEVRLHYAADILSIGEPVGFILKVEGEEVASGQLSSGQELVVPLSLWPWQSNRVSLVLQQGRERIVTFNGRAGWDSLDLYIDAALNISTEKTPPGFITQPGAVE